MNKHNVAKIRKGNCKYILTYINDHACAHGNDPMQFVSLPKHHAPQGTGLTDTHTLETAKSLKCNKAG
jgi:hypothetical protein